MLRIDTSRAVFSCAGGQFFAAMLKGVEILCLTLCIGADGAALADYLESDAMATTWTWIRAADW